MKKKKRFEYVKSFEQPDVLLPNTWIVVRIDGRGFHKSVSAFTNPSKQPKLFELANWLRLSDRYGFVKPNDRRALDLMNAAAVEVMKELSDLCVAYGVSDEYRYFLLFCLFRLRLIGYSFVFHPSCQLFERRNG